MRAKPVRTCVGCRRRDGLDQLLRTVVVEGVVLPDPRRRSPGRGASLHPDPHCLDLAERRRAFGRAFRLTRLPDLTRLREFVEAADQGGRAG